MLNSSELFAQQQKSNTPLRLIYKKFQKNEIGEVKYNPHKTAAIVDINYNSAYYINFKTQQIYPIIKNASNVSIGWLDDTTAHIQTPCGTGCSNSVIFIAPATTVSCPVHEYRIESINENEPPDYYNNTPLLIDAKRRIYVCYDDKNSIQIYSLPRRASIHPPKNSFAKKAEILNGQLAITYKNKKGKLSRIFYGKI